MVFCDVRVVLELVGDADAGLADELEVDEEDDEILVEEEDAEEVDDDPGSANTVPKDGVNVDELQQFPLYAQHQDPDVEAALHAITFTAELFPAIDSISTYPRDKRRI